MEELLSTGRSTASRAKLENKIKGGGGGYEELF